MRPGRWPPMRSHWLMPMCNRLSAPTPAAGATTPAPYSAGSSSATSSAAAWEEEWEPGAPPRSAAPRARQASPSWVAAAVSRPFTDGNCGAPDSGALLRTDPWSGPAGADGAVGAGHVAAGGLRLLPVGVGLLVNHLQVTAQLGDELLAGHGTGAAA